jgi:hypothetical protein
MYVISPLVRVAPHPDAPEGSLPVNRALAALRCSDEAKYRVQAYPERGHDWCIVEFTQISDSDRASITGDNRFTVVESDSVLKQKIREVATRESNEVIAQVETKLESEKREYGDNS